MYSFSSFLVPYRVLAATICTQDVREFGESAKTCLINHELSMFGPVWKWAVTLQYPIAPQI